MVHKNKKKKNNIISNQEEINTKIYYKKLKKQNYYKDYNARKRERKSHNVIEKTLTLEI